MNKVLLNAEVITPFHSRKNSTVVIENNKIKELIQGKKANFPSDHEIIDLAGKYLIPGLIDLHIHGAGGHDFAKFGAREIDDLTRVLLSHGITGILVTLPPKPKKELIKDVRNFSELISKLRHPNIICGIHLEGPFLNKKMHGALNPDTFWEPDFEDWCSLFEACRGNLKLMTIAPELPGCLDIIRDASVKGVVTSLGHTEADYENILMAIDNGVSQVTHIYNAMHPVHHRDPGVLGACYVSDELKVQLIADGIHVHPVTMKFLVKIKSVNGILLVSDAIPAATKPDGKYEFAGQEITIKDSKAFLADGTIAGSCLTLDRAVKTMVEQVEVPVTGAVRMATLNPARVLRKDDFKGIISVGKDADLVVMNRDLEVEMTILQGEIVYRK